LRRAAPADPVVAPNVFLICQSKSEHIIRDDEIADVDGRTLTIFRWIISVAGYALRFFVGAPSDTPSLDAC